MLGPSGGDVQGSRNYSIPELSVTMWISTVQANNSLFGLKSWNTPGGSHYALALFTANGHVIAGVYNGTQNALVSPLQYCDGQRHLVAMTLSSINGTSLYVDGELVSLLPYTRLYKSLGAGPVLVGDIGLYNWPYVEPKKYLELVGNIAQFAFFNYSLPEQRIKAYYAQGFYSLSMEFPL
jgi:hypothetical protein